MAPRILVIPGTAHAVAPAALLATAAAIEFAVLGADVTRISPEDYPLPVFDEGPWPSARVPEGATQLVALLAAHDGVLIATHETNGSLPTALKNLLDWTAFAALRSGHPVWAGRPVAIACIGEGADAGEGAVSHLRAILTRLGAGAAGGDLVLDLSAEGFDADGRLPASQAARLRSLCRVLDKAAGLAAVGA